MTDIIQAFQPDWPNKFSSCDPIAPSQTIELNLYAASAREKCLSKSISGLMFELTTKSRGDFQIFFGGLLGELLEGSTLTKRLGRYDQDGIDAFVITSDGGA